MFDNGVYMSTSEEWWKEAGFESKEEMSETIKTVTKLLKKPKGTAFIQLLQWRKIGAKMLLMLKMQKMMVDAAENTMKRVNDKTCERSHKKWTEIEDEQLINAVCNESSSIIDIACLFGRSPAAIKTRVSYLVGIKRVSSDIAGKFIGTLNGADIQGDIKGKLTKA